MLLCDHTVHLGIGIDTARYAHHVSFLDQHKRTAAPSFHFNESADGYQKLQQTLERLANKHRSVHLHMHIDAAGQYAENLVQWLHSLPFDMTISLGQPARNRAYRKAHFDKRKADPVESLACARFAIVERPPATPLDPPQFRQLRDIVALREAAAKHQTRIINQLHGLLARVFPELALHVQNLAANYVLCLLDRYPTPEKLARARLESLVKIPHLDEATAKALHAAAKTSRGSNQGPLAELLIRQKVGELQLQQRESAKLDKLIETAWNDLPDGPHRRLLTIKGVGILTAAALVAKIVSIDRFETAGALVGYFGLFPEEVDVSGTDRNGIPKSGSRVHMSSKGNDMVRRLLYTAAQCGIKWNPPLKALFKRQIAGGKKYNVAIGHCMAKLLRQVFALWKKDEDFDPDFESRQTAAVLPLAVVDVPTETANEAVPAEEAPGEEADEAPAEELLTTEALAADLMAEEALTTDGLVEKRMAEESLTEEVMAAEALAEELLAAGELDVLAEERASEEEPGEEAGAEEEAAEGLKKAVKPHRKEVTPAASKTTNYSNPTATSTSQKLPPLNFGRLREMVSITQVLEHVNWQPQTRRGNQWRGCCPLHAESDSKSQAFAVEVDKNLYCCHRCGSQGNALDLWIALTDQPILPAAWNLVHVLHLEPPLLTK